MKLSNLEGWDCSKHKVINKGLGAKDVRRILGRGRRGVGAKRRLRGYSGKQSKLHAEGSRGRSPRKIFKWITC